MPGGSAVSIKLPPAPPQIDMPHYVMTRSLAMVLLLCTKISFMSSNYVQKY